MRRKFSIRNLAIAALLSISTCFALFHIVLTVEKDDPTVVNIRKPLRQVVGLGLGQRPALSQLSKHSTVPSPLTAYVGAVVRRGRRFLQGDLVIGNVEARVSN